MNRWTFTLVCPQCDGTDMTHVTGSANAATINTTANATAECNGCGAHWVLSLSLHAVEKVPRLRMPSNAELRPRHIPMQGDGKKGQPVDRHPLVTACMDAEQQVGQVTRRARATAKQRVRA